VGALRGASGRSAITSLAAAAAAVAAGRVIHQRTSVPSRVDRAPAMRQLYSVVLVLCAALDGVRLASSVEDILRELRTHAGLAKIVFILQRRGTVQLSQLDVFHRISRPVFHRLPEPSRAWLLVVYCSR